MEPNPAVALFLAIGLIIAASRISGAIARRLGQPRVLGELLVGVLLGPTLLNLLESPLLEGVALEASIKELAELGVLLLMFIVGLEMNLGELVKVGKVGVFAGVTGAVAPIVLAYPVVLMFNYGWEAALFAGVTMAATSVSISAQVLLEIGHLRSKVGSALLAASLIDDVLAILLISLSVAIVGSAQAADSAGSLGLIIVQMGGYLAAAFAVAWFVVPRVINWIADQPSIAQAYGVQATALVILLLFGWSAEVLGGVAPITGAFIAGVGVGRTKERERHEIMESISSIAYTFLVPIFFVSVGLETDLSIFPLSALPLALLLLLVAVVSKIGGCGLGARLGGFNSWDSFRLGICMISRGEVGLIIAALGVSVGVFHAEDPLFASLFLVIILSTLITPLLVRQIFPRQTEGEAGI